MNSPTRRLGSKVNQTALSFEGSYTKRNCFKTTATPSAWLNPRIHNRSKSRASTTTVCLASFLATSRSRFAWRFAARSAKTPRVPARHGVYLFTKLRLDLLRQRSFRRAFRLFRPRGVSALRRPGDALRAFLLSVASSSVDMVHNSPVDDAVSERLTSATATRLARCSARTRVSLFASRVGPSPRARRCGRIHSCFFSVVTRAREDDHARAISARRGALARAARVVTARPLDVDGDGTPREDDDDDVSMGTSSPIGNRSPSRLAWTRPRARDAGDTRAGDLSRCARGDDAFSGGDSLLDIVEFALRRQGGARELVSNASTRWKRRDTTPCAGGGPGGVGIKITTDDEDGKTSSSRTRVR